MPAARKAALRTKTSISARWRFFTGSHPVRQTWSSVTMGVHPSGLRMSHPKIEKPNFIPISTFRFSTRNLHSIPLKDIRKNYDMIVNIAPFLGARGAPDIYSWLTSR